MFEYAFAGLAVGFLPFLIALERRHNRLWFILYLCFFLHVAALVGGVEMLFHIFLGSAFLGAVGGEFYFRTKQEADAFYQSKVATNQKESRS